jgi:ubiquinone/menaquinone biosynthesis C-methylase UbiE
MRVVLDSSCSQLGLKEHIEKRDGYKLNEDDLKQFYERVGSRNGWDFSKVNCVSEGAQWSFYEEVVTRCRRSDLLLDIGTGGGESLLSIADAVHLAVGVDLSSGMIQTALANLERSKKHNVRFYCMDSGGIEFPDGFFNIVSCRHAPFSAGEVGRVLTKDGIFLTQRVSEADKLNIVKAFGRKRTEVCDGTLQHTYLTELAEAGFRDVQSFEYDATEYYQSYEDLVFLLKHTPIIPGFGETEEDFAILKSFIEENQTSRGIQTNAKRFMIIAKK